MPTCFEQDAQCSQLAGGNMYATNFRPTNPHINSAATSAAALNGGTRTTEQGRGQKSGGRDRPPLPTAAAFAGARCDLARFHKDGIEGGFPEINIVCVSWKKMRPVITARKGEREGHRRLRRRGNGSTVTVLLHSLIRRSGENRGWRRDGWKGVPRRERPGKDDEIARSVLALDV